MIRCLIIDPDLIAAQWLESLCGQLPFLQVIGRFNNGFDAYVFMQHEQVDVLFMDTSLEDMTHAEFFKVVTQKPLLVFTSLNGYFALDAFYYEAVDYLLKPLEINRFIRCANRLSEGVSIKRGAGSTSGYKQRDQRVQHALFVNVEYKLQRLDIHKILYVEGLKDYLKIFPEGGKVVLTMMRMKNLEEKLPFPQFARVHRSYIVNLLKIETVQKNRIMIGDKEIPIGEMYSEQFFSQLERL